MGRTAGLSPAPLAVAALAVAALAVAALAVAAPAAVAGRPLELSLQRGPRAVHVQVHVAAHPRALALRLDGRWVETRRRRPFRFRPIRVAPLRPGRHDLVAEARYAARRAVARASFRTPAVRSPHSAMPALFHDSFESGGFTAGGWYHGQYDTNYGHRTVVAAAREGIDAHSGSRVARFEVTADDRAAGRYHAKLYKAFGTHVGQPDSASPHGVSGTYAAWYRLPPDYRVPASTWVSVFQFKEKYRLPGGGDTSDPLWWVQFGDLAWAQDQARAFGTPVPRGPRSDAPVAFLSRWRSDWTHSRTFVPVPLGRWFEIRAAVHQGDRVDVYLDGRLLDTGRASEYPVGPFHGSRSMEWLWGVGNYSTGANGPMYVDDATYTR